MATVSYEEVAKLAETLTGQEQIRLMIRLHEMTTQHELSSVEWDTLFDTLKIATPVVEPFPLDRDAWYDER